MGSKASELLLLRRRGTEGIETALLGGSRSKGIKSSRWLGGSGVTGKGVEVAGSTGSGGRGGKRVEVGRSSGSPVVGGLGEGIRTAGTAAEGVMVRGGGSTEGIVRRCTAAHRGSASATAERVMGGGGGDGLVSQTEQVQSLRLSRPGKGASGGSSVRIGRLDGDRLETNK